MPLRHPAWRRVIVELPHHKGGLGMTPLPGIIGNTSGIADNTICTGRNYRILKALCHGGSRTEKVSVDASMPKVLAEC